VIPIILPLENQLYFVESWRKIVIGVLDFILILLLSIIIMVGIKDE